MLVELDVYSESKENNEYENIQVESKKLRLTRDGNEYFLYNDNDRYRLNLESFFKSLQKTLGIPLRYFENYPVSDEIIEHFNTITFNSVESYILRKDKSTNLVVSMLSLTNYIIFDNAELDSLILKILQKLNVSTKNIYIGHYDWNLDGESDTDIYYGDYIKFLVFMDKSKYIDKIYPAIKIINNDHNFRNLIIFSGIYDEDKDTFVTRNKYPCYFNWNHTEKDLKDLAVNQYLTNCLTELFQNVINSNVYNLFLQPYLDLKSIELTKNIIESKIFKNIQNYNLLSSSFIKKLKSLDKELSYSNLYELTLAIYNIGRNSQKMLSSTNKIEDFVGKIVLKDINLI